jgi:hypothetical protein
VGNPAEETYCYPNKVNLRRPAPFVNKGCAQRIHNLSTSPGYARQGENLPDRKLCLAFSLQVQSKLCHRALGPM